MKDIVSRIEVSPVTADRAAECSSASEVRRDRIVVLPLSPVSGEVSLVLLPDLLL